MEDFRKLSSNIGIRISNYNVKKEAFLSVEPRILLNYRAAKHLSIKSSFSKMRQYTHLLTNSGLGFPKEFWLPATNKAVPSTSYQYTLGLATSLNDNYEFSFETYYKKMNDLITLKPGTSFFGTNTSWDEKVYTKGVGNVYGAELLLKKNIGYTTGWISYTLSKNYRKFKEINDGNQYPFRYDRTHDFSIVINHKIFDDLSISATWVYGTGQALTLPTSFYYLEGHEDIMDGSIYYSLEYVYSKKNAFRAKAYHRLDIGLDFTKKKRKGVRIFNISVYNAYNRINPHYYYFGRGYSSSEGGSVELYQKGLFPIIPSISYTRKF